MTDPRQQPLAIDPPPSPCPTCGEGVLTWYRGHFGPFIGCSRRPACRYLDHRGLRPGVVIAPDTSHPNLPTEAGRARPCPVCGSDSVARIAYGYPSLDGNARARLDAGEVALGGCVVRRRSPSLTCNRCHHAW